MKARILLLVILFSLTKNLFSERYIAVNGPIRTRTCSDSRMAGSPNYIRWSNSNIKWSLNENGCCLKDIISLRDLENAVANGFTSWDTITTAQFDFQYEGTTTTPYGDDGQNVVYWAEEGDLSYEEGEPLGGVNSCNLAMTVMTVNEYGEILDADIVFNGKNHVWKVNNSNPDVWAVTAHEVGHLLGLYHTDLKYLPVADLPTMISYYNSLFCRDVTFDDRVGVSFLYGGNLIDNENFIGKIYLKWTINVMPGKALTIQPGTSVLFFKEVSIRINGELNAVGTSAKKISFLRCGKNINCTWGGIVFMPGSKGTMNYCNVSDVKVYGGGALTINNSSPLIQNCTIENNTGYCHGICIINHATPKIYGNTIRNNSAHGVYIYNSNPCLVNNNITGSFNEGIAAVYCDYHAAPIFGTTCPPSQGNNVLTGSYYGLYATNSSMPCAGQVSFANHNTIQGNCFANAYAKNNSVIYAINNSWGREFSKIIAEKGSHIYYTPYLAEENIGTDRAINYDNTSNLSDEGLQQLDETYSKILTSESNNTLDEKNELMAQFFASYDHRHLSSAQSIVDQLNSKFPSDDDVKLASWLLKSEGAEINYAVTSSTESELIEDSESVVSDNESIADNYILYQNYPNPFNATTKIKYAISAALNPSKGGTLVALKIYDLLGNEVTTLVNEEKFAGTYEVEFNASTLSSGIYLYSFQIGNSVETKKMILLR